MHMMIPTLGLIVLGLGLSAPALADPEADTTFKAQRGKPPV